MRKTVFNLVFKDDPVFGDWHIKLHTSEPKTEDEVEELIMNFSDICNALLDDYSPVDVMDRLVDYINETGRDWWWEDGDESLVIIDW